MSFEFKLVSSLEKVFFERPDGLKAHTHGSMLKNERFSFQLVGWFSSTEEQKTVCSLEIQSELSPCITVYRVDYVPVLVPSILIDDDDDYITKTPGMFPDPLHRLEDGKLELINRQSRAFWICVEPRDVQAGSYPIVLNICDKSGAQIAQLRYQLEIIDARLPELEICTTGWFHGDCLAALHHVDMMSDAYFEIVEKYLSVYTMFGHNMILTPVFTPPLDTDVGAERPTNQLVDVIVRQGQYEFGFSKLRRWIGLCRKHGIRWFEISHLFTQWGAAHAPKIMADVDGVYRRIFGWETDALAGEYGEFLDAFLPALTSFLREEKVLDQCYFHISDEPQPKHESQYRGAREILLRHVAEDRLIDALQEYGLYEKGLIGTPVVSNDHVHVFLEKGVTNLWTYYCMGQRKDVANRFIAMPAYRNRILGYQLYKYQIKGFLHWGFNFWFSERSRKVIDPYRDSCAGGGFPSGDPFVVYPLDGKGEVVCSTRLYVFHESLQDLRALELLESLTDRETVESILGDIRDFREYPRSNRYLVALREKINEMIKENL